MSESIPTHEDWMQMAIASAEEAGNAGEIPVGAVLINQTGEILATSQNRKQRDQNPIAHAEMLAIQTACQKIGHWRLNQCSLYVTLEPCPMCTGAIIQARLGLLVYGAPDPKTGTIDSVFDLAASPASYHRLQRLGGICREQCRQQLQNWFTQHRANKRRLKVDPAPPLFGSLGSGQNNP